MTRQQVIDKITDDRVGLVSELCHHSAGKHPSATVPFEIDRSMNISSAMYFRPTMRTARLFVPDFDEPKFFLKLWVVHDFVP